MFTLPALPYEKTAFPNQISAETFDYHHGKHHLAYINNLNSLVQSLIPLWLIISNIASLVEFCKLNCTAGYIYSGNINVKKYMYSLIEVV